MYAYRRSMLLYQDNLTLDNVYGDGMQVAQVSGYAVSYVMPDGLGSVRLVMTSTGSATFSAGYEPYGEEYDVSGTTPAVTYAGAVYDQATGLYLMGARYYSPVLQRFITADSYSGDVDVPLSLNRYAYVGDDPVTYTDPSGHNWSSSIANLLLTITGHVSTTVAGSAEAAFRLVAETGVTVASLTTRTDFGVLSASLNRIGVTLQTLGGQGNPLEVWLFVGSAWVLTGAGVYYSKGLILIPPLGPGIIEGDLYATEYATEPDASPQGAAEHWVIGFFAGLEEST